jgi:hypothetical protein
MTARQKKRRIQPMSLDRNSRPVRNSFLGRSGVGPLEFSAPNNVSGRAHGTPAPKPHSSTSGIFVIDISKWNLQKPIANLRALFRRGESAATV